jgi:hypothetical protein
VLTAARRAIARASVTIAPLLLLLSAVLGDGAKRW